MTRSDLENLSFIIKEIFTDLHKNLENKLVNNPNFETEYKKELKVYNDFKNSGSIIQTSFYKMEENGFENIELCNKEHNKIILALKEITDLNILNKIKEIVPEDNWELIR